MSALKKIKRKTIEDILYFSDGETEYLLIKVRGRGWFLSSDHSSYHGLTPTRMDSWIAEAPESFVRVKVQHFHYE